MTLKVNTVNNIPKYKLVEKQDIDFYGFKITEGDFKDVVYYYGEVKIEEDIENDNARLVFDYQIDKGNEMYSIEELQDSVEFNDLMGDILVTILEQQNNEDGEELTEDNPQ